jgi:hypothetical protein
MAAGGQIQLIAGTKASLKANYTAQTTVQVLVGGLMAQGMDQATAAASASGMAAAAAGGDAAQIATADAIIDGFADTMTVELPAFATDTPDSVYCPAIPKEEVAIPEGAASLLTPLSQTSFAMHENQGLFPTKGFAYCYQQWQKHSLLANFGYSGQVLTKKTDAFDKELQFNADGSFPMMKIEMSCADLVKGSDYTNIIKQVRAAAHADTALVKSAKDKKDGDLFPEGIPFVFWEQYVELTDHLMSKAIYAGVVCLLAVATLITVMSMSSATAGVAALASSALWGSLLVVFMCIISMLEMYGFMGHMEIKLNAIPQVTLVMTIGMTVEFTAHILLAFVLAPAPQGSGYLDSRRARLNVALGKMAIPSIHGAITTFLGIVMLSGAKTEFIVLYYFTLYALLVLFGVINGLLVLPALLLFVGPPSACTSEAGQPSAAIVPEGQENGPTEVEAVVTPDASPTEAELASDVVTTIPPVASN